MKTKQNKLIPYLIIIVPLVLVLGASFFISSYYINKVTSYFESAKQRSQQEYIDSQKLESETFVKHLNNIYEFRYSKFDEQMKAELKSRVDRAYDIANSIYKKYKGKKSKQDIKQRIIDALERMRFNNKKNYIFMMNYNGDSILSGSHKFPSKNIINYTDADNRSIILEEIQKARKYKEGFLRSRFVSTKEWQSIYVKDLGFYNLYIGSSVDESRKLKELKDSLVEMHKNLPIDDLTFMALYEQKHPIYFSSKIHQYLSDDSLAKISKELTKETKWHTDPLDGYIYYTKYYEPFDWYLVYGFNISVMNEKELTKYKALEAMLDEELEKIVKVSTFIVLLIVILSLMLSRKINAIFSEYQNEVQVREEALMELNESLEQKVQEELAKHREKDKMLIQQSKMAEMGDMLSMIAHQWRQPLNQLSYVLMNIQSAYEYKELTKEYLDEKIKEANIILEFMSTTIDDFKDYFKPDKEKEFVLVSDVVSVSANFMQKSLELDGVSIELSKEGRELTHIYKNEFIQVLLNLIKNAKDALTQNKTPEPKIMIKSKATESLLIVEVCDNGGGIDESIMDDIFKPYFSTKDDKKGTGLGLYMSKMIIEEHIGGKLSVENKKDEDGNVIGACFKIEI
jgi:signal transduction histidine kinase